MRVSIFGLGYVGAVSAACLAKLGHDVIGVDVQAKKVDLINQGQSPVIETDLDEIIANAVAAGRLSATSDAAKAVGESDLSMLCVGTPSQINGNLDVKHVRHVAEEVGSALEGKTAPHMVVLRSTVLPGTTKDVVIPALEGASGKRTGDGYGVCYNPEFLREGSAVKDFFEPPKTVIGEQEPGMGESVAGLYEGIDAPMIRTSLELAEMIKYADNAWHALKIGFANEIGNICKALGIDSHRVMEIFCLDTKLNLSRAYLRPGFAFGGSCLPKDLRALTYRARALDLDLPILESILPSNERQVARALQTVIEKGNKKVGVLGFSFKAGTDDLRESPIVELIERLLGKGYDLRLFDRNVKLASLGGANRDYILNHIPHISNLMVENIDGVLSHADTVVIGNADPEFKSVPDRLRSGQALVDLVRIIDPVPETDSYDGINW